MILQFIFIERYRNFVHQGFNLSGQFAISYIPEQSLLEVSRAPFFIENFFGPAIKDLKVLVGENGVGKSSLFDYIVEELAQSSPETNLQTQGFVLVYRPGDKQFVLTGRGKTFNSVKLKVPKEFKETKVQSGNRGGSTFDEYFTSVLGRAFESNETAIFSLSNVFDTKRLTYEGADSQSTFDLTNDASLARSLSNPLGRNYKSTVNFSSIKFVVGSQSEKFIPSFPLPKKITVVLNSSRSDLFIDEHANGTRDAWNVARFIRKTVYYNKKERLRYWMYSNLLIEITQYLDSDDVKKLIRRVDNPRFLSDKTNLFEVAMSFLDKIRSDKRDGRKRSFSNSENAASDWIKFLTDYDRLSNLVTELFELHDAKNDDFNSFTVPLTKQTSEKIFQLTELIDRAELSFPKVSLLWDELSTGETMLLNFFSKLFALHLSLETTKLKNLIFLFDEVDAFYHPQWQKRLVKSILNFFAYYYSNYNTQLLMTAHSPIIISDIPKSNVLFLKKTKWKIHYTRSIR